MINLVLSRIRLPGNWKPLPGTSNMPGSGGGRIEAPILPALRQQQGFGHAGLTFSLGDNAAGYAALSLMPLDHDVLTAEIKSTCRHLPWVFS